MDDLLAKGSVYTLREVPDFLCVSPVTLIRAIRKGRLKALRVEGQWRIFRRDLEEYLQHPTVLPAKPQE